MSAQPTEALAAETLARLRAVAVPALSGILYARGLRSRFLHGIIPANPDAARFVGPAFTIRAIPVREDLRDAVASGRLPIRTGGASPPCRQAP